jgi:hypothetical protein
VSPIVKFLEVDPDEVPNVRDAHRGRVSYPILKGFLETGMAVAQLDRTGMQQSLMSLSSSLGAYIRGHELPIKLFMRKGEIYLARTDLDDDAKPDPKNNDIKNIKIGANAARELEDDDDVINMEDDDIDEDVEVDRPRRVGVTHQFEDVEAE